MSTNAYPEKKFSSPVENNLLSSEPKPNRTPPSWKKKSRETNMNKCPPTTALDHFAEAPSKKKIKERKELSGESNERD